MPSSPRIIVAMDFDNQFDCWSLADRLDPSLCRLKVGKELFTCAGPKVVEGLMQRGFDVFLDLKFHDIPNTTAKAVKAAAEMGVWMVNVHASGGERMMTAARNELDKRSGQSPLLIAVTVLTSMESSDFSAIGINVEPHEQVLRLASLAKNSGMDGVVCSAQEATLLSRKLGSEFCLVTPGIRPVGYMADDQRRIVTPVQALQNGSHYLVIGRPITQAENPMAVCQAISHSLKEVLS
jgi:orotidine-5'-phosphate decarboxylase